MGRGLTPSRFLFLAIATRDITRGGMEMKWYDIKSGIMGWMPKYGKYILFPTFDEYKEAYAEATAS